MVTFSTLLLVGCNLFSSENVTPDNKTIEKTELQKLYETTFNGNSIVIKGDTVINQKEIQLHNNQTVANIDAIKNANGTFKMVAIGGGLTAGARDGGLYRNGQLTSFPNLIAIQMKADFKQPLFAQNEANGYGYKVVSNVSNGIPKYKAVSNNIALLKSSPIVELSPYNGEIDNWGVPFSGTFDLMFNKNADISSYDNPFKTRLFNEQPLNALDRVLNTKFDLVIIESGLDTYIKAVISGTSFSNGSSSLSQLPYATIMDYSKTIGAKAIIANIPSIVDFPFLNFVNINQIRKINNSELAIRSYTLYAQDDINAPILSVPSGSLMIPNALADSLLNPNIPVSQKRGFSYKNPLRSREVYTTERVETLIANLENKNKSINFYANYYNYPVVDLYTLYKKVAKNELLSDDGIKVTQQNFFSSDGIFPSAFGQSIIANEYIKTINSFYKTNIPLIQTAYYLNK